MKSLRIAGALTTVAALALPAAAAAHPSVHTDVAKVVTDANNPTSLTDQARYVVTNHGFTFVLRETNGLGESAHKGVFDYKRIPGPYRATLTDWNALKTAGASGAQAHATCQVPPLESEAAVRAWQGTDPFYAYVPFQKGSAGLEDDPATWIPVVQARTGVDLTTVTDPEAACEALPGANTSSYAPADETQTTTASLNSGYLEHETAPLKAAIADADKAKAGLQALLDGARAEVAKLAAALAPMKVALPTARISDSKLAKNGTTVTVTGPVGKAVSVKLAIGESRARKMKLSSSTLARGKATLGADGTAKLALKPGKVVANRIDQLKRSASITVSAFAGDRVATTTATLTR